MFEKYPSISPYTYCANNPVMFVDPTGEKLYPTIRFQSSKLGNIYNNLTKSEIYQNVVGDKYVNSDEFNIFLDFNTEGLNEKDQAENINNRLIDPDTKEVVGNLAMQNFSDDANEISLVYTILHEAVHAVEGANGMPSPENHDGFDRKTVYEGLVQYNKQFLNGRYSNDELEIISWSGLTKSPEFDKYIYDLSIKNKSNFDFERLKYFNKLEKLLTE